METKMCRIPVLDAGYVALIDKWGSDEGIVESARMSTGKGFNGWETDERFLSYLYTNKHLSPFEQAGLTIEVKAPIFILREWHRHRTQSYNEMSARYIPLPDEHYIPFVKRLLREANTKNKQEASRDNQVLSEEQASSWREDLMDLYNHAQQVYESGLSIGVPKELARLVIPAGRYSRMRASANLRNWLGFLDLRLSPNAQWEIQKYAEAVGDFIAQTFPRTWAIYVRSTYK